MLRKRFKNILALTMAGIMLWSSVPVSATNVQDSVIPLEDSVIEEFAVSFDADYAEVGKALSAVVTGASDVSNVTYQWNVDGLPVSNESFYTPTETDLEAWIEVVVNDGTKELSKKIYCSKLPVVYIDTDGATIQKDDYIDATIKIQGNAQYSDDSVLYDGITEIKGRGNSTWPKPKKPYRLKLDEKTDLFGMGESKHWVLLANYMDESLMRNTLAYDLSGEMGMEHISTVWVDVIMNGDYVGNYQLCEQIRVDDERIEIFDWEGFAEDAAKVIGKAAGFDKTKRGELETYMAENMSWITSGSVTFENITYQLSTYKEALLQTLDEDYGQALESIDALRSLINGGYVLELDSYYDEVSKFKTASGQPMMFKNPEFVATNIDMLSYVQGYVQAFEDAVNSPDYTAEYDGESTHYSDLYDLNALIDYWLVTEIFFNEEMNKKSTYMYKDVDELMTMGPIWDMDWSSGAANTSTGSTSNWATLYFNAGTSNDAQDEQWYKYLVQDPYFLMKLQERYWEIRGLQVQDMLDRIDVDYKYLKESGEADTERWQSSSSYDRRYTFGQDVTLLKQWLNRHVEWMDSQMATEDSLDASFITTNNSLSLTLTDQDGKALDADMEGTASADALAYITDDLKLTIAGTGLSGTAKIFINSKAVSESIDFDGTEITYEIPADALTEDVEKKNVIEVKIMDISGNVTASNYITVKQSSCDHSYGDWNTNEDQHWKECTVEGCDKKVQLGKHTFEWVIDTEATENTTGIKHEECTVCGAKRSENTEYEYVEVPLDPADSSKDLPLDIMSAISESEKAASGNEGPDDNILDNDPNTIWHTNYISGGTADGADPEKRWVGVSFKEPTEIYGIRYLPRNDGTNGTIVEYLVQYRTSDDGNWIDVAEGRWEDYASSGWKLITFDKVTAKQVRIKGVRTSYPDTAAYPTGKHMSMAEFRVIGDASEDDSGAVETPFIPVSEMTATAGDWYEGEEDNTPGNAIDENEKTIWHTDWDNGPNHENHWLKLELKEVYTVDSLHYLPRQENSNGIITEYEIYVSLDNSSWTLVASGKWGDDTEWKTASFNSVEAKYVKLVTIDAVSDRKPELVFASAAEVRLTGTKAGGGSEIPPVDPPLNELKVKFDNAYAKAGEALTVTVEGAENVSYSWKVDGKPVSTSATYTPTESDIESWIEVTVSAGATSSSARMYFSKLPVVYIDTEGGQTITSKEDYIDAAIKIQGNDRYSDSKVLYDGETEIRGRGNTTWGNPKKPYRLKLSEKCDAFGMGKSKHWVLLANYWDGSLMRNTLAYDLSGDMGMEHLSTVWVNVILNGDFVGNYQFCENIRVDGNRVDIFDWESFCEDTAGVIAKAEGFANTDQADDLEKYMAEKDMSWITAGYVDFNGTSYYLSDYEPAMLELLEEDYDQKLEGIDKLPSLITGGYILELDEYFDEVSKFYTESGQPIMFKNPEFVNTNDDMMKFVQTYVQAFEDAVKAYDYTATYEGEDIHYSELYDMDALIDYWLVTEIFFNEEINKKSTYMYKPVNEPMKMGPIWDMDWSSNGMGQTYHTDQWATNFFNVNAQSKQWYKDLVQDPYFLMRAQERYWEIRDNQVQGMLDAMDGYYDYLKESGAADDVRWASGSGSFENDYKKLKNWLNTHIFWMDTQMETEDSFDAAFLQKDPSLGLTLTTLDGSDLEADTTGKVPADVIAKKGSELKLSLSKLDTNAYVFINGKLHTVFTDNLTESIPADKLAAGEKNVIEVKEITDDGTVVASNYITVRVYGDSETEPPIEEESVVTRLYGGNRFDTGFAAAEEYKKLLGVKQFEAVVVATGYSPADALSGSYLAVQNEAPILLADPNSVDTLVDYVKANLVKDGKVYILGGTGAVPADVEEKLADHTDDICRLKGGDRFGTNIQILNEAGIEGATEILVATGWAYADSLSASAVNKPIMLVNKALTADQKAVLDKLEDDAAIYILGGTAAVSEAVEAELAAYGTIERVKGADRFGTSVEIAKKFFGEDVDAVTFAYGWNYPDGLCGGPIAYAAGAPLLLVHEGATDAAAEYAAGVEAGYIFGGSGAVADETVKAVLGEEIQIVEVKYGE